MLSGEESKATRGFDELYVRSETGLGAEVGGAGGVRGARAGRAAAAMTTQVHS